MAVQFSRGCPFDCEFCDIIVMNGRVPRTKTPAQLIAELEALRLRGWKDMVFIVDDNFIGDKKRTKELLREMIAWRERTRPGMGFFTEASVNLADDAELCELMVPGRLQEGLRRHRDALGGKPAGMPQAPEQGPRPGGVRQDPAARRPGGHGRVHRGFRQRPAGHFQAPVRVHPALGGGDSHGRACCRRCRRPGFTSA